MTVGPSAILALAAQCAPNVSPQTVAAIVAAESHGRPFALNVNNGPQPAYQTSAGAAGKTARRFIAAGYSVDLGLGQINSRNMSKLGLSWETVFDPCVNIAALGKVLTGNYDAASKGRDPQSALRIALSLYNTGSPIRGFTNGYVATVVGYAGVPSARAGLLSNRVDALATDPRPAVANENAPTNIAMTKAEPPAWNLFARAAYLRDSLSAAASSGRVSVWRD